MPIIIRLTPDAMGIVVVGTGVVSVAEVLDAYEAYLRDHRPEFAAARYFFADYTDMTSGGLVISDVKRLAEFSIDAAGTNPHLVLAVCAPSELIYAGSRIWAALIRVAGWKVDVSRDRASALSYIQQQVSAEV
jgi:hypothetical protein